MTKVAVLLVSTSDRATIDAVNRIVGEEKRVMIQLAGFWRRASKAAKQKRRDFYAWRNKSLDRIYQELKKSRANKA